MKRILHVGPGIQLKGGIASVLAGYKDASDIFEHYGYTPEFLETYGRSGMGRFSFGSAILRLLWICLGRKISVVQVHASIKGSLFRKTVVSLVCLLLRQKYVLHVHSGKFTFFYTNLWAPMRWIARFIFSRASHVICLSDYARQELIASGLTNERQCCIVYNGLRMDESEYRRSSKSRETIAILFLGKLIEAKGAYLLLDALGQVKANSIPFELFVGGNGNVKEFERRVSEFGLNHRVHFLGWVDGHQKIELLRSVDIFALPSRSEGFSVAIVEAMASGVAILSTNIPGVIDAIENEISGLLVEPDDTEALCAALRRLLENESLRSSLGRAARDRYTSNFTMDRIVKSLALIYDDTLNNCKEN